MNIPFSKERIKAAAKAVRTDPRFRAEVLLYVSLAVNVVFAVLQAAGGILNHSIWSGTLAFYYITLSVIRFNLLAGRKKESTAQKWGKYRSSAVCMLVLLFALVGIQCITLYMGHTITYSGYMIYAIAAYTFYAAIAAIRSVVVYRRYDDPIISASKALSLAVAAISIYSLQSAMISQFGDSPQFKTVMGICVGAGIFIFLCAVSVFMIVKSTAILKKNPPKPD